MDILSNDTVLSLIGSAIVMLIAIISFFAKREFDRLDAEKKEESSSRDKLDNEISTILNKVTLLQTTNDDIKNKFDEFDEKFDTINSKLQAIDKDSSTTKHELEIISNMIKPLFEIKGDISRTSKDIGMLFQKSDENKDAIHDLSEKLHELEKQIIMLKK